MNETEHKTEETETETEEPQDEVFSPVEKTIVELRDQGLEDKDIVRKVFEKDINADIQELVRLTDLDVLDVGRAKSHVVRKIKAQERKEKQEREGFTQKETRKEPPSPPAEVSESDERTLVATHGREGLNIIKKKHLQKVLALNPGIGQKSAALVMHKWEINTRMQDDPNEMYNVLHNEVGIKVHIAQSVVRDVFSIEQKFADILMQKGDRPIFYPGLTQQPAQMGYPPQYSSQYGGYPPQYPPQYGYPPGQQGYPPGQGYSPQVPIGYVSREEMDRKIRDAKTEGKMEKLESTVKDIPRMIREAVAQQNPNTQTIEVPIDAEGNPCKPEDAVSVKRIIQPIGAGPQEDWIDKMARAKQAGLLGQDITEEKIRSIVHESGPKEDPKLAELKSILDKQETKYEELKDSISAADRKRLEDTMGELKSEINSLQTRLGSSGVNSPEGVMATGITELGRRNPVKEVVSGVREIITSLQPGGAQKSPPTSTPAAEEIRNPVLRQLREKGLVTTVRERVRGAA